MADSSRLIKAALLILILVGLFLGFSYWAQVSPPKPHPAPLTRQPPETEFLQSFFRSLEVYEDAFAAAGTVKKVEITGGIVSHHFLARNLIARFFAGIDPGEVERVILVGPDHYRRLAGRQSLFLTTPLPWKTPYGVLEAEALFIRGLLARGGGAREDGAFRQDHGV